MNKERNIILSVILTIVSIGYTFLVKMVDVGEIGPNNSAVGLSTLNSWFKGIVGSNMTIYKITEILGLVVILIVGVYGLLGLMQLIKRKSLFKVDREIIILGVLYLLMAVVYVFFEKFIVNYRPVLINGELEASYPSSHTILAICICVSSLMVSRKYLDDKYIKITDIVTVLLLLGVFLGRIISGVHWISDIIGGVLISATLLMYFYTIIDFGKKRKRRRIDFDEKD